MRARDAGKSGDLSGQISSVWTHFALEIQLTVSGSAEYDALESFVGFLFCRESASHRFLL